ncbi:hypothetical protein B0H11DRAFT_215740 [Mycena galericulata]|nr:hypothetical protein B0H11DRAFT_215740 [Mycena galericulata]
MSRGTRRAYIRFQLREVRGVLQRIGLDRDCVGVRRPPPTPSKCISARFPSAFRAQFPHRLVKSVATAVYLVSCVRRSQNLLVSLFTAKTRRRWCPAGANELHVRGVASPRKLPQVTLIVSPTRCCRRDQRYSPPARWYPSRANLHRTGLTSNCQFGGQLCVG